MSLALQAASAVQIGCPADLSRSLRGPRHTAPSALRCPASLEGPGQAIQDLPARRGECSPDIRHIRLAPVLRVGARHSTLVSALGRTGSQHPALHGAIAGVL